ncbi:hypothetical protein BGX28_007379 [Mortierella sp. GBA30]|nr:hypothetical protein BGX28_007379 [Mortierella sp. GBA30]
MTSNRPTSRDSLSSAENGHLNQRLSIDGMETTALLNGQRQSSTDHLRDNGGKNPGTKRTLPDRSRKMIKIILSFTLALLLLALAATLVSKLRTPAVIDQNGPLLIKAKYGAVAAEEIHCSEVGVEVLKEGGNAVDAAIASCLCIGTINSFAAGIGGGGFMAIRLPNGEVETIDFRETAPSGSYPTMFKQDPILAQRGGLAVAVPGELRGLELAHRRHGQLPWERLFAPSVKLAREGWAVGPELARRIALAKDTIEADPDWTEVYASKDGTALTEGEWIKREAFADTLEAVGREGADAFYTGKIARMIVNHVRKNGGILTMEDMGNYEALVKEPMVGFYHGRKIYATPAPTSGPALIGILNILEGYNLGKSLKDADVDTHRLVEAMKFGFAQRTELGDPDFIDLEATIESMLSKDTAAKIRANISDTRTFPVDYYNPHWGPIDNHGTTHLSTVDKDDMAVTLTSTVNLLFGSKLLDPQSGVILNDEMDDFSIPGQANAFGLLPSPYNYPEPGKRPLSSCVPTIVERNGKFEMALGGSGGSRIITAVLQTILNVYDHDQNIMDAIENPRIHHQLMPNVVDIEEGYSESEIEFLRSVGHNVTLFDRKQAKAEIQAVMRLDDGYIYASSDTRKQRAVAAGF